MSQSEITHEYETYPDGVKNLSEVMKEVHWIPKFQRGYDWGKIQCESLFKDLQRFRANKHSGSKYMFGQIVSYNSYRFNRLYVLDGQQRLTTASLMVAAIDAICTKLMTRDQMASEPFDDFHSEMKTVLKDYEGFKLNLAEENKEYFCEIIKGALNGKMPSEIDSPHNNSQANMYQNYCFFFEKFCDLIEVKRSGVNYVIDDFKKFIGNEEKIKLLYGYFKDFTSFRVCAIYVTRLSEAYDAFEVINNRGLPLSSLELLKNHIYGLCYQKDDDLDNDTYHIESRWKTISDKLTKLGNKNEEKYLRYFVNATISFVQKDKVYEELIRDIDSKEEADIFIDQFTKALEFFDISQGNNVPKGINNDLMRLFKGFSKNHFDSYSPIALAIYLKDSGSKEWQKNLCRVLKGYDRFYVLGVIPGLKTMNAIEQSSSQLAISYYHNDKNLENIISEVNNFIDIGLPEIQSSLELTKWGSSQATYVLSELFNRNNAASMVDQDKVQVEHILPQKYKQYWGKYSEDDHRRLVNKIGNLLLLNGKINNKIKNKPFSDKIKYYKNEGGPANYSDIDDSYFIGKDVWDEKAINARTKFLVTKILASWLPVPCKPDNEVNLDNFTEEQDQE